MFNSIIGLQGSVTVQVICVTYGQRIIIITHDMFTITKEFMQVKNDSQGIVRNGINDYQFQGIEADFLSSDNNSL